MSGLLYHVFQSPYFVIYMLKNTKHCSRLNSSSLFLFLDPARVAFITAVNLNDHLADMKISVLTDSSFVGAVLLFCGTTNSLVGLVNAELRRSSV